MWANMVALDVHFDVRSFGFSFGLPGLSWASLQEAPAPCEPVVRDGYRVLSSGSGHVLGRALPANLETAQRGAEGP